MRRNQPTPIEPHLDQTLGSSYKTLERVTTGLTSQYESTPSAPLKSGIEAAFNAKEKLHETILLFERFAKNPKRRIDKQQAQQLLGSLRAASGNVRLTEGFLKPLVSAGHMSDYHYNQLVETIEALDNLDHHLMGFMHSGRGGSKGR